MHLFLSPHADDIAYSLGGVILKGIIDEGMLVTVFQRSSHVPNIQATASIDEGSAIRFQEDCTYTASTGLAYQSLGLPEAIDRGYQNFDVICQEDNYATDPDRAEYESVIQALLAQQPQATTIWVPLAIGCHIDHVIVNRAVLNWQPKHNPTLIFYEDLPYTAYWDRARLDDWMIEHIGQTQAELIDISDVFAQKMHNITIYQSQVNDQDTAGVKQHGLSLVPGFATERIWRKR